MDKDGKRIADKAYERLEEYEQALKTILECDACKMIFKKRVKELSKKKLET
jgi:hypothetical protein